MILTRTRIDLTWIVIAVTAIAIGILVYLLDRSPEQVYFIPDGFNPFSAPVGLFGVMGYSLPSFVHVFSMILITGGILSSRETECFVISVGWLFVEVGFEVGQVHSISYEITQSVPAWVSSAPILEAQQAFFINGTFDSYDILAIAFGAIAAYTIMRISLRSC